MSQVITGARAIFTINNQKVAFASDCNYTWSHNMQPVEVLDQLEVAEHAEVGMSIDFSCTMFRVARKSAVSLGIQPKLSALLSQPELVVTISDKVSGDILLSVSGVKLASRSGSVNARGVWTESLNFVGRLANDEEGA